MAKTSVRENLKKIFFVHLAAYFLVMGLLGAINFQHTPDTIWVIYPAIGWGLGVLLHFLSISWNKEEFSDTREGWKKHFLMRSFIIHFVVYALIMGMLVFINLTYSPDLLWVIYPALGWGIGIVMHLVFALLWQEKPEERD